MSNPGETAAPTPVVEPPAVNMPEPVVPVTEIDIPADGGFPSPEPEPSPAEPVQADGEPKPSEPAPIKKSPFQARIDALTAQREQLRRETDDYKRQAELYKAMAEGNGAVAPAVDGSPIPQPQPVGLVPGTPEFQRAVAEEARRVSAIEAGKARTDKLLASGNTEYKDFTERCNLVASLGAGDRQDFMQIVTDPEIIPDGHKLIAYLADHPEEAAKAVDGSVNTAKMTAMLVKMAAEANKPPDPVIRPVSSAPAPIKTIDGSSRANDEPSDRDSMAEYARKFKAQQAEKLKSGQPGRFARH